MAQSERSMPVASWANVLPVLPGKRDELQRMAEYVRQHRAEYEQSRTRAGMTLERVYLMSTPQGDFAIGYGEGEGFEKATRSFATSGLDFDRWFGGKLAEVTGLDLAAGPPPPAPEQILAYVDEGA